MDALTSTPSQVRRFFESRFSAGSIKGSMLTLVTAMVGAGTLAMPFVLSKMGLIPGLLLVIAMGVASDFSLKLLIMCTTVANTYSYREMAHKAMGRCFSRLTVSIIVLNLWGNTLSYMVVIKTVIPLAFGILIENSETVFGSLGQALFLAAFVVLIIFPLSMMKDLRSLRHSSMVSLVCFVYLLVVTIEKYFVFCHKGLSICLNSAGLWDAISLGRFNLSDFAAVAPIALTAYACHPAAIPVYRDLQRPCPRRIHKVMDRAVVWGGTVYCVVGFFGYLTFGSDIMGNLLLNDYHHNTEVVIGAILLCLSLTLCIPTFTFTARLNIEAMFFRHEPEKSLMSDDSSDEGLRHSCDDIGAPDSPRSYEVMTPSCVGHTPKISVPELLKISPEHLPPPHQPSDFTGDSVSVPLLGDVREHSSVSERAQFWRSFGITLVFLGSAFAVAVPVGDIAAILGLMGATTTTIITVVLPALFIIRLAPTDSEYRVTKIIAGVLAVVMSVLGVMGVLSILGAM
eukprot:7294_1